MGVAPGVGIYGLRVLRADGNGAFSDLVRTCVPHCCCQFQGCSHQPSASVCAVVAERPLVCCCHLLSATLPASCCRYDHLIQHGRRLGVRVVNLSLSGSGTPEDVECSYVTQLIAQGMTVVTAAGALPSGGSAAPQPRGRPLNPDTSE